MTTLTVKRHTSTFQRQYVLNTYCDTSDGANFCACQRQFEDHNPCMFYGRNLEPLAFSINKERIVTQAECTLLTGLPREIRQMIWEYALTDTKSIPAHGTFLWRGSNKWSGKPKLPASDIAFSLVQSCKAIYLETYRPPLQLNPYIVYDFQGPFRPDLKVLAPWQAALIQRMDIGLQQMALEAGELRNWLTHWYAKKRHEGAYIAPFFKGVMNKTTGYHLQAFPFETLSTDEKAGAEDGDEVTLPIPPGLPDILYDKSTGEAATRFSARAMLARPLTHLTLRLCHEDWWTWNNDPARTNPPPGQLSLDPAVGLVDGSVWPSGSVELMERLADHRRAGEDVQGNGTWGAIVERLPDLKELTLVLETFDVKQDQLERVVACAKTWRFPIEDTEFELVWNGEVGDASWEVGKGELDKDYYEEDVVEEEGHGEEEDTSEEEEEEEEEDGYGEESDETSEEEYESDDNVRTPSWNKLCTKFEVRVLRFVRRKVERGAS